MLSQSEFEEILSDPSKHILGDITWITDDDHSPALEFRVQVRSNPAWPLTAHGTWNPARESLSYVLIHGGTGRVVGLCLGFPPHRNPDGKLMSDPHKHRWTVEARDQEAYEPDDITFGWHDPSNVWQQFCGEMHILHEGALLPPEHQGELTL